MIIPIGAKVKIKDNALPASRFFAGSMAMVIGCELDNLEKLALTLKDLPGMITAALDAMRR